MAQLVAKDSKCALFPHRLAVQLQLHREQVSQTRHRDLPDGYGRVQLPLALLRA